MQEAAGLLIGEHDFSAFRAAECQAAARSSNCARLPSDVMARRWRFEFEANAFCTTWCAI